MLFRSKDERLLASLNLETVRCIGSGSAPLDPSMIRRFKDRFGIEVVNIFGSNEGVSLLSNEDNTTDAEQRVVLFPRWGRAEIPWPDLPPTGIRTRLIDPTSGAEVLQRGTPGEMQIIGPTVFDGYWRAPQVDAESFTVDGWFRTGDLFELQGDGATPRYYKFVGRHKQVINRGGVKIGPGRVEVRVVLLIKRLHLLLTQRVERIGLLIHQIDEGHRGVFRDVEGPLAIAARPALDATIFPAIAERQRHHHRRRPPLLKIGRAHV